MSDQDAEWRAIRNMFVRIMMIVSMCAGYGFGVLTTMFVHGSYAGLPLAALGVFGLVWAASGYRRDMRTVSSSSDEPDAQPIRPDDD